MSQEPPATTTPEPAQEVEPTTSAAPQADVKALQDQLSHFQREAEKARREAQGLRERAKAAEAEALKKAEMNGDYEQAKAAYEARIAELEPLQAAAQKWSVVEEAASKDVAALLEEHGEDLPGWVRSAADAAPDPLSRREILTGYLQERASQTAQPAPPPKPSGGGHPPQPGGGETDWSSLVAQNGDPLRQAIAKNPAGWQSYVSGQAGQAPSFVDRLLGR